MLNSGLILKKSLNNKYLYTEKEPPTSSPIRRDKRDIETGYDYFGVR